MNSWLAYGMAAYLMSAAIYLALTRRLGTPFKDSLTDHQKEKLAKAKAQRLHAFGVAFLVSSVILMLLRPFESCSC